LPPKTRSGKVRRKNVETGEKMEMEVAPPSPTRKQGEEGQTSHHTTHHTRGLGAAPSRPSSPQGREEMPTPEDRLLAKIEDFIHRAIDARLGTRTSPQKGGTLPATNLVPPAQGGTKKKEEK
jgi:hypothetical protein